jgi:hypothetical protein
MMKVEDSVRALNEMNGAEIDGKTIEVKKARRTEGYEKTPGVCKLIYFPVQIFWSSFTL